MDALIEVHLHTAANPVHAEIIDKSRVNRWFLATSQALAHASVHPVEATTRLTFAGRLPMIRGERGCWRWRCWDE